MRLGGGCGWGGATILIAVPAMAQPPVNETPRVAGIPTNNAHLLRTSEGLFELNQPEKTDQPPEQSERPSTTGSLFRSEDGGFDASGFLSSRTGFLPLAMPISEPAVGYGLALGLSFFHSEPKVMPGADGEPGRVIMPSITVVMGAATENGTWAGALAHLGVWDEGRIRYTGAGGYTSLNLEWFGRSASLGDQSISYTNDVLFLYQNIRFKLGESDFFLGPTYRFLDTDASFDSGVLSTGIADFELQSRTSGAGVQLSFDSLDHPFAPTRGVRADLTVTQQATWLGGDFDYTKIQSYGITHIKLGNDTFLGLKLNGDCIAGDAPFYDLVGINIRGLARARYVDNVAIYGEAELRHDFAKRWSGMLFGGAGEVASSFDDLGSADAHFAGGVGFRYLIAERYGLRLGVDVAYGDNEATVYISVGTGWIRP